jgi:ATP-dependent HslUV protease subunit HslV
MTFHSSNFPSSRPHATTILGVKRGNEVAMAGDGQVTLGDVVLKHGARKIRTLADGQVLAGFAGAVADALTLFEKFEAQLIVADPESLLVLSGEGDVIEPDDGIVAIGSGAPYATAAAKALVTHTDLDARSIVLAAMTIAANLCIFTNDHFTIESVRAEEEADENELGNAETEPEDQAMATMPISAKPSHVAAHDNDDDEDEDEDETDDADDTADHDGDEQDR